MIKFHNCVGKTGLLNSCGELNNPPSLGPADLEFKRILNEGREEGVRRMRRIYLQNLFFLTVTSYTDEQID
jgi:hypothetical protein